MTEETLTVEPSSCTRCGAEPRLPRQRWGTRCFTAWKRARRTQLRVGQATVQHGVRVLLDNPANRPALLIGPARVLTFTGPIMLEALNSTDADALRELTRAFPRWARLEGNR